MLLTTTALHGSDGRVAMYHCVEKRKSDRPGRCTARRATINRQVGFPDGSTLLDPTTLSTIKTKSKVSWSRPF